MLIEKTILIIFLCILSLLILPGCVKRAKRNKRTQTVKSFSEQYPENWTNSGE